MKRTLILIVPLLIVLNIHCGSKEETGMVGQSYSMVAELPEEDNDYDFDWIILEKPEESLLDIDQSEFSDDSSELTIIPDVPGNYLFKVTVSQYSDELLTQSFTVNIEDDPDREEEYDYIDEETEPEDLDIYAGEDSSWLEEEPEEETDDETAAAEIAVIEEIAKEVVSVPSTAPPPKPKPAKKKPVPGSSIPFDRDRFTIQLGAKKTLSEAEAFAAELIDAGFDAYIQKAYFKETDELWYRVRIGSYDNKDTAIAVSKSLSDTRHMATWVDHVRQD